VLMSVGCHIRTHGQCQKSRMLTEQANRDPVGINPVIKVLRSANYSR